MTVLLMLINKSLAKIILPGTLLNLGSVGCLKHDPFMTDGKIFYCQLHTKAEDLGERIHGN